MNEQDGPDAFVLGLPTRLRNCLLSVSLNTESRIRDSFARDGGYSICETENLGTGQLRKLREALSHAADERETPKG